MSPTETATTPSCPQCGAGMKSRRGSRGDFLGCTRYPECRGTRVLGNTSRPASAPPARPDPPVPTESLPPGPSAALIADLRKTAGHLGAAINILRRRGPEIDRLVDERDGVTF